MADDEPAERLARQLERERQARREAEDIAEAGMRRLYLQTQALTALAEVGQIAIESATFDEALDRSLPVLGTLLDGIVGHALLVDGERMAASDRWFERSPGDADALRRANAHTPFQVGLGAVGIVAATGEPRWVEDVGTAEDHYRAHLEPELAGHSAVLVPVHVGTEVAAVVEVYRRGPAAPDPDLLAAATQIGELLGRVVERERATAAAAEVQTLLERRVAERTADLDEARSAAEASSRAKTELLANLGHELRTPLAAVLGMVDLVREVPGLPDAAGRDLATAARSARVLRDQVERLIALADLERGTIELERREVVLADLLAAVVEEARPRAEAKALVVALRTGPDAPERLRTDPVRLAQAVGALVENAVKFTEHGQVVVSTEAVDRADPGAPEVVRITVHDTGVGMDASELDRMTHAFVSGDAAPSRRQTGMGIGLAIASRLLARLGGRLGARGLPEGGTAFWVDLPVDPGRAPTARANGATKVLLVEDNEVNRRITGAYLARLGLPYDSAVDGAEAIRAVASGRYGLVLMDLQMPVVDGYQATARIRSLEGDVSRIPIVAVTASTTDGDRERCLAAGMDGYLAKPFGRAELAAAIAPWLPGSADDDDGRGKLHLDD